MKDGSIMHDEDSVIGDVAETAKRAINRKAPRKTLDDDLAGVSVVMDSIPQKTSAKKRVNGKKKKVSKNKKAVSRKKKK